MPNSTFRPRPGWRRTVALLGGVGLLAVTATAPVYGQGSDTANMQVRIDQLEEQVRVYSGQIEGLQFQITQLQTLIERIQEDNDFRFQQLEGGGSGESEAAPRPDDQSSSDALPPQVQTGDALSDTPALVGDEDLLDEGFYIGSDDDLYASDVFGEGGTILGSPEGPLGSTQPSEPLDFSFDPDAGNGGDGDANAQYQAGYEAIVRGETAFAEEQFRQFMDSHPQHPQAPDATYWLGSALVQRGAYDEAADILLTGFETYPTSSRAPDILLTLGMALHGAGEFDTACRTYSEVLRRYPESTEAFRDRVVNEQAQAGC